MVDVLTFYKDDEKGKDFAFVNCFKKLQGCKKMGQRSLTLNIKTTKVDRSPLRQTR
jgi:uncharacterized ParB-like nuclease family protein